MGFRLYIHTRGYWSISWNTEDNPVNSFVSTGFMKMKRRVYSSVDLHAHNDQIVIAVDSVYGDEHQSVTLPNTPETIEFLTKFLDEAKSVQKPLSEDERAAKVEHWKKLGYIDG